MNQRPIGSSDQWERRSKQPQTITSAFGARGVGVRPIDLDLVYHIAGSNHPFLVAEFFSTPHKNISMSKSIAMSCTCETLAVRHESGDLRLREPICYWLFGSDGLLLEKNEGTWSDLDNVIAGSRDRHLEKDRGGVCNFTTQIQHVGDFK